MQVAARGGPAAIIDPLASGIELSPIYRLIGKPDVVKVLHAARQDIEIFWHQGDVIPDPLFDTQIAAMVCGFGDSASYETLVRRLTNAELDKSARFTDWSRRPLSNRQLEYALADVTHLCDVYERLSHELRRTGRESWVQEEIAALKDEDLYELDPANAWKRLKPRTGNKKFLGVLAAIAGWREQEAQTRDVPRQRILRDEALLEIAAHPPATPDDLERVRAVPKGFAASRSGKALMDAVAGGLNSPSPLALANDRPRRKREPSPSVVDLLKTLLRLKAEGTKVAPRLIASSDEIERIAAYEDDGVPALHGWRAEVFGRDAIALRDGKLALALENGEAVVVELEDE
jgi:ribonuclease D